MTRERPREQRGARAADMQVTGGGGGEAGADHGGAGREKGAILPDQSRQKVGFVRLNHGKIDRHLEHSTTLYQPNCQTMTEADGEILSSL
jgi:hypothetical protein